jgi:hypothetical protein
MKVSPELFIWAFKKRYWKETEYFFTHWGCKIFSDILVKLYNWEQYHYLGHYITKINNRYWDITGEIFPKEKNLDKPWYWKAIEDKMESYENIYELCLYELLNKNDK